MKNTIVILGVLAGVLFGVLVGVLAAKVSLHSKSNKDVVKDVDRRIPIQIMSLDPKVKEVSYRLVVKRYYCAECPIKHLVFTNTWSGSHDNNTYFILDSAYIAEWMLYRLERP